MSSVHPAQAAKPELDGLRPYEPGLSSEALQRRIGTDTRIVKLGSNEAPWGPTKAAQDAIRSGIERLNLYPDGAFHDLRQKLSGYVGAEPEQIMLGNGADSLLINISLAFLKPGDEVVYGWPSFITYPVSVMKVGAKPVAVPLDSEYRYDLDAMLAAVTDKTRLVYICNPNNPTGTYVSREQVTRFLDALPERVMCVIDEAYHEYVTQSDYPDSIREYVVAQARPNVAVLRTMSKAYGLAGLRIGWGAGPAAMVRTLDTIRGPFEMNALANLAAMASIDSSAELAERVEHNDRERTRMFAALEKLGFAPIAGQAANFICIALPAEQSARELAEQLQLRGVIVRPLDMFGMSNGLRITVGSSDDNDYALEVLATL